MMGDGAGVGAGWWVARSARWARWVGWCERGVGVGRVGGWEVVSFSRAALLSKCQWEARQTQQLSPAKVLRFIRGVLTFGGCHGVAVPLRFAAVCVWRVRTKTETKVGRTTVNHVATALPAGRTMRSEAIRVFQKLEQSPREKVNLLVCAGEAEAAAVAAYRVMFLGVGRHLSAHPNLISAPLVVI